MKNRILVLIIILLSWLVHTLALRHFGTGHPVGMMITIPAWTINMVGIGYVLIKYVRGK